VSAQTFWGLVGVALVAFWVALVARDILRDRRRTRTQLSSLYDQNQGMRAWAASRRASRARRGLEEED
jgi:hypothetical protein